MVHKLFAIQPKTIRKCSHSRYFLSYIPQKITVMKVVYFIQGRLRYLFATHLLRGAKSVSCVTSARTHHVVTDCNELIECGFGVVSSGITLNLGFVNIVFTRVIHAVFNQNFVSKFRVRDLCEETILRRFIMNLKCDNQFYYLFD